MHLRKTEASDAELVETYCQNQNKQAFAHIYQRYFETVYRFAYSRTGNRVDAEEVTSETFFTLLDVIDKYDPEQSQLSTFILGVAYNKTRQLWQQKDTSQMEIHEEWIATDDSPPTKENIKKIETLSKKMKQIVSKLPENYAQVLKLRFFDGLTISQAAQKLNITQNNLKVRQNRAIKKAQQLAKEVDYDI